MADIELVIKIPEEKYNEIHSLKFVQYGLQSEENKKFFYLLINAINDGAPLPKGHNILDENKVVMELVYGNLLKDDVKCGDITSILKDARIIEADKESEE